ncbi:hypothetical protein HNY73_020463 [Argiope bruennichi]|uniref:Uncharacterized protein n=1 Tax=Argiope bruennichi TaxID=94029 RepID=A0A8T0E6P4_ARGBR|nr:hypothetical protein HNY73_020463 [Argiope bruennichi]
MNNFFANLLDSSKRIDGTELNDSISDWYLMAAFETIIGRMFAFQIIDSESATLKLVDAASRKGAGWLVHEAVSGDSKLRHPPDTEMNDPLSGRKGRNSDWITIKTITSSLLQQDLCLSGVCQK